MCLLLDLRLTQLFLHTCNLKIFQYEFSQVRICHKHLPLKFIHVIMV